MTNLATASSSSSPVPFNFKNHPIRTILDDGSLWFVAKDVCGALGISWKTSSLGAVPPEWKTLAVLGTGVSVPQKHGGLRGKITIISEPAVYKLAFRSNKPEADEFTNWVASVVLPSIRKTGKFEAKVSALPSSITPEQQQHLRNLVAARAKALPHGAGFPQIWERVKNHFKVARYQDIPAERFEEAVEYLLKMDIRPSQAALPESTERAYRASDSMDKKFTDIVTFINRDLCGELFSRRHECIQIDLGLSRPEIDASFMLSDLPSDMVHRGLKMVEAGFFCIDGAFRLLTALNHVKKHNR